MLHFANNGNRFNRRVYFLLLAAFFVAAAFASASALQRFSVASMSGVFIAILFFFAVASSGQVIGTAAGFWVAE